MSLRFENSNPERFQHFCQSLLLIDFPDLQCFPVAQPDGGRDGFSAGSGTVLQVKYKRQAEAETAEWMISTLEGELPKIQHLIERGAKTYIMATNALGTAHLDSGRIDKVNDWMAANISIPAYCYWHDDLERRLDKAPIELKLRYPEVLDGRDALQVVMTELLGSGLDRPRRAVKAFVTTQFAKDENVKFKQVHLTNQLTDLFIDVSLTLNDAFWRKLAKSSGGHAFHEHVNQIAGPSLRHSVPTHYTPADVISLMNLGATRVGAARFLLSSSAQDTAHLVVLQGGPGQGKSTLAQYVCQVHRARYLGEASWLEKIPDSHKASPFRIPMKIDLRDLAQHLAYDAPEADSRSLETYLSGLIQKESGGLSFAVDDLIEYCTRTPTLLFLDGLDEIADLEQRKALVISIKQTISRLKALSCDVQIVITSRPSVLSKPVDFLSAGFAILDLAPLSIPQVNEYAERWTAARKLDAEEAETVHQILGDKLQYAHIVELTRNPMQLAILLSLIHSEGPALPDQRTDLYDRYLNLFLLRESEKDDAVREHKSILLAFVRHLAWTLQSEAESQGGAGSVSEEHLRAMVRSFLTAGAHPPGLEELFKKGLERIYVLVERVEGLYEFEVQPLREFFAARHLYETSPIGTYRGEATGGDRAQRFEAMARNPFWLNVVRFYAGSYESGAVGSLVLSLKELINGDDPAAALHARQVGIALLTDWVFSNKKFYQRELIELVFDHVGVHVAISDELDSEDSIRLDPQCGQDVFRDRLFDLMCALPTDTRSLMYASALADNGGAALKERFLPIVQSVTGRERSDKWSRMVGSGAARDLSAEELHDVIEGDSPPVTERQRRYRRLLEDDSNLTPPDEILSQIVQGALELPGFLTGEDPSTAVGVFTNALSNFTTPYHLLRVYSWEEGSSVLTAPLPDSPPTVVAVYDLLRRIEPLIKGSLPEDNPDEVWVEAAQVIDDAFGETWFTYANALAAAAVPFDKAKTRTATSLFDQDVPASYRARYARMRRGSDMWWLKQLEAATSDHHRMFWSALVVRWTSPDTFNELRPRLELTLEKLSDHQLTQIQLVLSHIHKGVPARNDRPSTKMLDLRGMSVNLAKLVIFAFGLTLPECSLSPEQESDPELAERTANDQLLQRLSEGPSWSGNATAVAGWLHAFQVARSRHLSIDHDWRRNIYDATFPADVAAAIIADPIAYPIEALDAAVSSILGDYEAATLTATAKEGDWSWE